MNECRFVFIKKKKIIPKHKYPRVVPVITSCKPYI